MRFIKYTLLLIFLFTTSISFAQEKVTIDSVSISAAQFRSIGPAFMTGRISDVVIDPLDENHWYVGVGSGGVWETKNAGVSFKPIFDQQKVYSIGCITLDTNARNLWVGSGENVGGRHISFGDGIYLSKDGGKTWKNKGLKYSNHISKIVIHPSNSETIWVAAQGPLWSSGGDRGVYKSVDGGNKWKRVLGDAEWTGATDLQIDPRNPDVLYAATWQRHRTVASYMGGGPKSGIYKSIDGGNTWQKLKTGLPSGSLGKIGLAISPQNPDVLYAAIETKLKKGGFYRSADRGMSWSKQSDQISAGTGPHYYQEIWACPHQFDRVYFANNYFKVTNDGGKTFKSVGKAYKHVDNHAVAFKANDPDYLMVGTDGGLYESFDLAKTWRHMGNLPITQFYKLAVDDAKPFYHIYGGTQDNNTQRGKSRTENSAGISNADWDVVLGGDGHQPATEPGNPNIVYGQSQQGWYSRIDIATGERIGIRPQPRAGEEFERYNWDAPIFVSSHNPARVYVASHRLWRSDDRGDSWTPLSGDLTRNEERFELPIMGRKQRYENAWDVYAMSTYNTITSIAESPINEEVLYVGTDDGFIQRTKNGGKTWVKTNLSSLEGVPKRAYVNDIKADLFDENTVYIAIDAHKQGDYKPHLFVSTNGGNSWKRITNGIKEKSYVWRIVQDHISPNLLFIGTEFGIYVSVNGGDSWKQLKNGLPTISFRDLVIQREYNDLVAASFGRSFYVLDNYAFLRELSESILEKEAFLFTPRATYLFRLRRDGRQKSGSLGGQHFYGENPEHGVLFDYYVKDQPKTAKQERDKKEIERDKNGKDIDFPGWETLAAENQDKSPAYWLEISDSKQQIIRKLKLKNSKGIHRTAWDMKGADHWPVNKNTSDNNSRNQGWYVAPGNYTAQLYRLYAGDVTPLGDPVDVVLKPLRPSTINPQSVDEQKKYMHQYMDAHVRRSILMQHYNTIQNKTIAMLVSNKKGTSPLKTAISSIEEIRDSLQTLKTALYGNEAKNAVGEKVFPTLNDRMNAAGATLWGSNYGPTATAKAGLAIANRLMDTYEEQITSMNSKLQQLYKTLRAAGSPVVLELEK
ncbi:MAG: glycosyl hydrolase [Bacteroidia bacterium]|nr:glycosyl hydrolase [Bacteroidia bacterium]